MYTTEVHRLGFIKVYSQWKLWDLMTNEETNNFFEIHKF